MKVGVLGLGFMGTTHVKAWAEVEEVDLAFGSVESMLADTSVDAVDICLPTDMHAAVAIAALRAGKHVLVEKPMALDFGGAQSMRLAAREAAWDWPWPTASSAWPAGVCGPGCGRAAGWS